MYTFNITEKKNTGIHFKPRFGSKANFKIILLFHKQIYSSRTFKINYDIKVNIKLKRIKFKLKLNSFAFKSHLLTF